MLDSSNNPYKVPNCEINEFDPDLPLSVKKIFWSSFFISLLLSLLTTFFSLVIIYIGNIWILIIYLIILCICTWVNRYATKKKLFFCCLGMMLGVSISSFVYSIILGVDDLITEAIYYLFFGFLFSIVNWPVSIFLRFFINSGQEKRPSSKKISEGH